MMHLQQFVAETIAAVIAGVKDAQVRAEQMGGKVNPYRSSTELVRDVDFDIEVSTAEGTATRAGLGVFVGAISAGTQGQSEAKAASVGRIKFSVAVELPTQPRKAQ